MEEEITVNGEKYIKASSIQQQAEPMEEMPYVIVRTYSAGVFAGYLAQRDGKEVTIKKARRLWYWSGAASLSQLAMEGVKNPGACKFPCEVETVTLLDAIEILNITQAAKDNIAKVPIWKM